MATDTEYFLSLCTMINDVDVAFARTMSHIHYIGKQCKVRDELTLRYVALSYKNVIWLSEINRCNRLTVDRTSLTDSDSDSDTEEE